jgi:hypothetical protein
VDLTAGLFFNVSGQEQCFLEITVQADLAPVREITGMVKGLFRADVQAGPVATGAGVKVQNVRRGKGSFYQVGPEPDAWAVTWMDEKIVYTDAPEARQDRSSFQKYTAPFHVVVKIAGSNPFLAQPSADTVR